MNSQELIAKVQNIVSLATSLKNKHTTELKAPVNYACIFCQTQKEFDSLRTLTLTLGEVIEETPSGPLYLLLPSIKTVSGELKLLKIRKPDSAHPELGDADFTVSNYPKFKESYITKTGFKLIPKKGFEMIELMEKGAKVRAYFSNPTVEEQLKV